MAPAPDGGRSQHTGAADHVCLSHLRAAALDTDIALDTDTDTAAPGGGTVGVWPPTLSVTVEFLAHRRSQAGRRVAPPASGHPVPGPCTSQLPQS